MSSEQVRQLLDQAKESLKYSQFHAAAEHSRRALELESDNAEAHAILGIALSRMNQAEEATRALETALRLAPDNPRNYYNLAAHFFSTGRRDDAFRMAREALQREPDHAAAAELVRRLEGDLGPAFPAGPAIPQERPERVYDRQPGYVAPAEKPRLAFVRNLGIGWDLLGWLLAISVIGLNIFIGYAVFAHFDASITDPNVLMEQMMAGLAADYPWAQAVLIAVGALLVLWWILDLVDKRPSTAFIVIAIVGMLGTWCCACFPLVLFPVYIGMRNRP